MAKTKEMVIKEIKAYMVENGGRYSDWYVGIPIRASPYGASTPRPRRIEKNAFVEWNPVAVVVALEFSCCFAPVRGTAQSDCGKRP